MLRKDDMVQVIAGRDKGKTGKVLRVNDKSFRVTVEKINLVKRHSKPRGAQSPGGIVEKEAAIDISNVMIMCDRCNAPVRIGIKASGDDKTRICRRCGEALGNE